MQAKAPIAPPGCTDGPPPRDIRIHALLPYAWTGGAVIPERMGAAAEENNRDFPGIARLIAAVEHRGHAGGAPCQRTPHGTGQGLPVSPA